MPDPPLCYCDTILSHLQHESRGLWVEYLAYIHKAVKKAVVDFEYSLVCIPQHTCRASLYREPSVDCFPYSAIGNVLLVA